MVQQVKMAPAQPSDLNSIPRTHVNVEEENQPYKKTCCGRSSFTHKHTYHNIAEDFKHDIKQIVVISEVLILNLGKINYLLFYLGLYC